MSIIWHSDGSAVYRSYISDSDVESIEAGVDCDFRGYCYHLQSDFPIPCDTGYVDYRQHSDYRTGCGFYLCFEVRAIIEYLKEVYR